MFSWLRRRKPAAPIASDSPPAEPPVPLVPAAALRADHIVGYTLTDAQMEHLTMNALRVRIMMLMAQPGREASADALPIVSVYAADRPDVRDLGRIHASDGDGDVTTHWVYALHRKPQHIFFVAELTAPVATSMSIAFELPRAEQFLRVVGQAGKMIVTTAPALTAAEMEHALAQDASGIGVEVSGGQELLRVLDSWKAREQQGHS